MITLWNYLAIKNLSPYAEFGLRGDNLDTLEWYDDPSVVPQPSRAEIEAEAARLQAQQPLNNCKDEAKKRIAATDWSVLADVGIANVDEYVAYREALRNLIKDPVIDPVWPTEPQPIWK